MKTQCLRCLKVGNAAKVKVRFFENYIGSEYLPVCAHCYDTLCSSHSPSSLVDKFIFEKSEIAVKQFDVELKRWVEINLK